MQKLSFLLIFLLVLISPLKAEILKSVEVSGNKRTSKDAIIKHGQIKIGKDLTPAGLQEIREHLSRINQIRLKDIEFRNGILSIQIEDKWTLFPVPMITESGNYHNRGFLLYEDSFLGTLGTLAPGVSWANSNFNAILYYQDESLFSDVTGIKVLLMKKSEFVEFKRKTVAKNTFEDRYNLFMVTPNYLYKNQVFKAGPIFVDKSIRNIAGEEFFTDQSFGLFFRHHLNAYTAMEVMYEGLVTTYDIYALKSQNDRIIWRHEADAKWSKPMGSDYLNFGVHAHHINDQSYRFPKYLGGDEGYRGYDKSSFPASRNAGAYAQYQYHLFKKIYLSPFYEFNSSKLIKEVYEGKIISENTVGVGLRYYFKKISIPAVIFDYGKNLNDKSNHFHINVGVSI